MARSLRIVRPCDRAWTDLVGDDARRFCDSCHKFVHNLDALSRLQLDSVLQDRSSCVTFVPRSAGSGFALSAPAAVAAAVAISALGACSDRSGANEPTLSAPSDCDPPSDAGPSDAGPSDAGADGVPADLTAPAFGGIRAEEPPVHELTAEELECLRVLGYAREE